MKITPMREEEIARYNVKAVSVGEEAQRVDRETRHQLRKEEIARYSLALCHHTYA
jgi:hypothetical protein